MSGERGERRAVREARAVRDAEASVAVRVKPGSSRTRVGGRYDGRYGTALVVAVNAPPVDGRATEAARRALAEALGVRASDVTLRAGATGRDKLFTVAAPPAAVAARLRNLHGGPA